MNRIPLKFFFAVLVLGLMAGKLFAVDTMVATNAAPLMQTNSVVQTNAVSAQELARRKQVHDTMLHLYQIQMNSDAASLAAIMAETTNAEPQIRKAAVNAAVQFGDRSVIPQLQKLADATSDPFEKVDILKAIDYMKLPSLAEYSAYRQAHKKTNAVPAATNIVVVLTNAPAVVHP
jgi:hypothetical protein